MTCRCRSNLACTCPGGFSDPLRTWPKPIAPLHRIAQRAYTPEDKREVMERILAVWAADPHQRLGQLLMNVLRFTLLGSLFMLEDFDLVAGIEKFGEKK